jgi:hypothetical protein
VPVKVVAIVIKLSLVGKQLPEKYLSFIDSERGGFGVIFPEVMIFSENIITEGNIAESPERRVYKCYIIPKVKELTKFRINSKTC